MNGTLNVMAVAVALLALIISSWFALRQVRYVRHANHLPITQMVQEFRSPAFIRDLEYVERRLPAEHDDPALGIGDLQTPAKESALNVAYYLQTLAALVIFDIVDSQMIVDMMGARVCRPGRLLRHSSATSWNAVMTAHQRSGFWKISLFAARIVPRRI